MDKVCLNFNNTYKLIMESIEEYNIEGRFGNQLDRLSANDKDKILDEVIKLIKKTFADAFESGTVLQNVWCGTHKLKDFKILAIDGSNVTFNALSEDGFEYKEITKPVGMIYTQEVVDIFENVIKPKVEKHDTQLKLDENTRSRIKWFYGKYFRIVPSEAEKDKILDGAIDIAKKIFTDAFESGKVLQDVVFNNTGIREDFKVKGIDGNTVSYTAKNARTGEAVDTTTLIGKIMPRESIDFIIDSTRQYFEKRRQDKQDREEAEKRERERIHELEKATYETPEFKEFDKVLDDRFPTVIGNYLHNNWQLPDDFVEFFKSQTDEIKKGLVNYIKHMNLKSKGIEYLDGSAYYKQLHEDEQAERNRNELIKELENL